MRRASWALMSIGVLLIAYVGVLVGYQSFQQHRLESAWTSAHPAGSIADATPASSSVGAVAFTQLQPHLADGQPLAKLSIPRIGFDAIVTEGSDSGILSAGPGHENHTGYPGEGRIILIGNHNGFSMSWGDLHAGDTIQLEMGYGRYKYTISKREIVDGNDQAVVRNPVPGEHLYLTTCWPLWQGALAGQRLVFIADPAGSKA
jgi:LPXTG-site transpeptidase (sortase) family protein